MTSPTPPQERLLKRRTVASGVAWSVPAVALATSAPAFAMSLVKDPGINGWVLNTPRGQNACGSRQTRGVEVTSRPGGNRRTPDGAPWGLYLYDVEPANVFSDAQITYWLRGTQTNVSWRRGSNHSGYWSGPVAGEPATKCDGHVYTPYTWTYTGPINPANVASDGRLYLGDFHVIGTWNQVNEGGWWLSCPPHDYWTQRSIKVDKDGDGTRFSPEVLTFERRNGASGGPYTCSDVPRNRNARSVGPQSVGPEAAEPQEVADDPVADEAISNEVGEPAAS